MCAFFDSGLGTPALDGFRDLCSLLLWRDLTRYSPSPCGGCCVQSLSGGFRLCAVVSMEMHTLDLQPRVFPCLWKPEWVSPTCCKCCLFVFNWILALCFRVPFDQILCVYVCEVCYMHLGLGVYICRGQSEKTQAVFLYNSPACCVSQGLSLCELLASSFSRDGLVACELSRCTFLGPPMLEI